MNPLMFFVFDVLRQSGFQPELRPAGLTIVRFLVGVQQQMRFKCVLGGQLLIAVLKCTREWFLSSMRSQVALQHVLQAERLVTLVALMGSLIGMDQLTVTHHFSLLLKTLSTFLTLELSFVRVTRHVRVHVALLLELVAAMSARIQLGLAQVLVRVLLETAAAYKDLIAELTAVFVRRHGTRVFPPRLGRYEGLVAFRTVIHIGGMCTLVVVGH